MQLHGNLAADLYNVTGAMCISELQGVCAHNTEMMRSSFNSIYKK